MTLVEIIQSAETYSGTLTITDGKPGPIFRRHIICPKLTGVWSQTANHNLYSLDIRLEKLFGTIAHGPPASAF
ncbi:hypothetical protein CSC3H3_10930 [Thalassospira marina]|uniref:Uncharacterized protein n=1 Tax=Thalassospira marina TaxID=2048283 RepID=A0ABN5FGW1_9PROT|nr:hypothetical protein CSC3H3_10930 [Thalassospira marina]